MARERRCVVRSWTRAGVHWSRDAAAANPSREIRATRERLVVVGGYNVGDHASEYAKRLQPPPNVELRGEVDEVELAHLYAQCRGLICTAQDEDFGMTPVEAMASGKFVLAVDEGGFRETVVPGETGMLLPPNPVAFAGAIASLTRDELAARVDACRQRARDELGVLDRHDENLITPLRRFAASRLRRDKPALHGPRLGANPHLT